MRNRRGDFMKRIKGSGGCTGARTVKNGNGSNDETPLVAGLRCCSRILVLVALVTVAAITVAVAAAITTIAATAVATTVATVAESTATAAAAITATVTAAETAAAAFRTRTRLVHNEITAMEGLPVGTLDSCLTGRVVGHFHESEAAATVGG